MKQLLFYAFVCTTALFYSSAAAQSEEETDEHILLFHSDIRILESGKVRVKETIRARVTGEEIQHGLRRTIPVVYATSHGFHTIDFDLVAVKKDQSPSPFHVENAMGNTTIYIGDKDRLENNGIHTYVIEYEVGNVLFFTKKLDKFSWNVNGTEWGMRIDSLSATVYPPKGAKWLVSRGNTGHFGSVARDYILTKHKHRLYYAYDGPVFAGNNLTITVGWSKNHVHYPNLLDKCMRFLRHNPLAIFSLVFLMLLFVFNYMSWKRYGKDLKPGTIMPQYDAPEGLCAAECGYIHEKGDEDNLFTATLVSLAVQGFIYIEEKTTDEKTPIYVLSQTDKSGEPENKIEALFLKAMFRYRERLIINEDHPDPMLYSLSSFLFNALEKAHQENYVRTNENIRWIQRGSFVFILITTYLLAANDFGSFWFCLITPALTIAINQFFSYHLDAPTAVGRKVIDHISGQILYMKYADTALLKTEAPVKADRFQKNLPYAIALGLTDIWVNKLDSAQMKDVLAQQTWMHSEHSMTHFSRRMNHFSSSIAIAAAAPARSFSGGGGTGGFSGGGGGFSGGGFGGGGGGGW